MHDTDLIPRDVEGFHASMDKIVRRSSLATAQMHASIAESRLATAQARVSIAESRPPAGRSLLPIPPPSISRLRRPINEEELLRETDDEMVSHDIRDVPELQAWADDLGYRHGYTGRPLRFSVFAQVMRKEHGREYAGLEPKFYESYYVGGHMRGENAMVSQAEYAFEHGERAPVAPVVGPDADLFVL